MYCRNCGQELPEKSGQCPHCGKNPLSGQAHCQACGFKVNPAYELCQKCGSKFVYLPVSGNKPSLQSIASPETKNPVKTPPVIAIVPQTVIPAEKTVGQKMETSSATDQPVPIIPPTTISPSVAAQIEKNLTGQVSTSEPLQNPSSQETPAKTADITAPGMSTGKAVYPVQPVSPQSSPKSRTYTSVLAICPGWLGIAGLHRFYLGKKVSGLVMLLTLGGLGIWTLFDFVMALTGRMKDKQGRPILDW
jgi:hypothetical protein